MKITILLFLYLFFPASDAAESRIGTLIKLYNYDISKSIICPNNLYIPKDIFTQTQLFVNQADGETVTKKIYNNDQFFFKGQYQNTITFQNKATHTQPAYFDIHSDIYFKIPKIRNFMYLAKVFLKKESEETRITKLKHTFILLSSIASLGFSTIILFKFNKEKKHKYEIIQKFNHMIQKNKIDLMAKDKTINFLRQNANASLPALIKLVQANSPHFWSHFQLNFPNFTKRMLEIHPNLKTSELTLSAYLYLGLTTKEISQYTFKSVKTVENNRYNLRKKINIESEKDLSIWIQEHTKNHNNDLD
ncbi:LuxR C-terminal-related transcriptional regulator [Chryseobacterium sp.]|uniref:helix-turn-helix transcriptional regulator n=1 Tax=Chryseobacterium sp. TaxID=1871047 RepID=UPI0026153388|nr:LuxR C-terminal-related transcriptional regulator [Chryseobacterium sp.]